MSNPIRLRPAQEAILNYEGGRLAVSAVPGSGKTFTLSRLAAQLIGEGRIEPEAGQEILIVTYLNAGVDNFKTAIRAQLRAMGQPAVGFDVRTLHSLSLEIVRTVLSGDANALPLIIDDSQRNYFLNKAIDVFRRDYPDAWTAFATPDPSPNAEVRWRGTVEKTAKRFIQVAKNARYTPQSILSRLKELPEPEQADHSFAWMLAHIYGRYEAILQRQGALDYDDQVALAVGHLEDSPGLAPYLRQRWPYVLEDEAQDSVPLQEDLLERLTGPDGNWVRVGDPNQAITSTFTAADPRFFINFTNRKDVRDLPLPNSGRCALPILETANRLVHWVVHQHPVREVRRAFRDQMIRPTPPGDSQPNPEPDRIPIKIAVYKHREEGEIPAVVDLAQKYAAKFPQRTVAILVPTHNVGHSVATALDERQISYDSLIRGGTRPRQVAAALHALLALLAEPLHRKWIESAFAALVELEHPLTFGDDSSDPERLRIILRSLSRPERFLFPQQAEDLTTALPRGQATPEDVRVLEAFAHFLRRLFDLRPLPVDDMVLALGDELFAFDRENVREIDLSIAYQIAFVLRSWRDTEPEWRLPQLVAQLEDVALGRRGLSISRAGEAAFQPRPGYITLATQHSAKGLEWDAVFLVGIDRHWIPNNLEDHFVGVDELIGGDPTAEATAQLRDLMDDRAAGVLELGPTQAAHVEVISERLRLLYVGITRARRFLHISRSRMVMSYRQTRPREATRVMGVLYRFIQERGYGQ